MSLRLYFDVQVPIAIYEALTQARIGVLTSQMDDTAELSDTQLLDRATELGRVLVTQDKDFLAEAARRLRDGIPFAGLVYAPQRRALVSQYATDLRLLAEVYDSDDMMNRVEYLPLK